MNKYVYLLPVIVMAIFSVTHSAFASAVGIPKYGTIGAPALNQTNISENGGILFEVRFDAETFSGNLIANKLNSDGSLTEPDPILWEAKSAVDSQSDRNGGNSEDNRIIFTSGKDAFGKLIGRRFDWDHLNDGLTNGDDGTENLKALVDSAAEAEERDNADFDNPIVNWVRGGDRYESASNLRVRASAMGNIVHSSPAYVGPPNAQYPFPGYAAFRRSLENREAMIYVGANDGMLHGFQVSGTKAGAEVFAYIPHEVLGNLSTLTRQSYTETYYVDGSPTVGDIYGDLCDGNCWRTILVSGLNSGGNAVFALDVTDPVEDVDTESNAASKLFRWEFSSADDADLGKTFSNPIIAQLNDGTWATIFGNGRGAGNAVLFILNVADGSIIKKLEVSTSGGNGLSSPVGWDQDSDGDIDYVYAGDLEGNLWKFDLTISIDPKVAFSGNPLINVGLPITTKPVISVNPNGGIYVYFGTGITGQFPNPVNGIFGIMDNINTPNVGYGSDAVLVEHTTVTRTLPTTPVRKYRVINTSSEPTDPVGWKVALPPGELILNNPILNNQRISFTSTDPSVTGHNQNWFNGFDYETGSSPPPFLDVDQDGVFKNDPDDLFTDEFGVTSTAVGKFLELGVVSSPTPGNVTNGLDTVFITHGMESISTLENPFVNPGLEDGSFDQDNFDWEATCSICLEASSCWQGGQPCHSDSYDDEWNINGVNMLFEGGSVTDPPNVESASGILGSKLFALYDALKNEADRAGAGYRDYDANELDEVFIHVVNPYSVDTVMLAAARAANGVGDGKAAGHATIYFKCKHGDLIVLDAPAFNALDTGQRTCVVNRIEELRIKFPSTNGLRATAPECVQNNNTNVPMDSLGSLESGHNTPYRNGAITIQALRTRDNVVLWENSNYEHLKDGDLTNSPATVKCDYFNESLRAFKTLPKITDDEQETDEDHDNSDGSEADPSGGGTVITETIDVTQHPIRDGRVSWNEILE